MNDDWPPRPNDAQRDEDKGAASDEEDREEAPGGMKMKGGLETRHVSSPRCVFFFLLFFLYTN
jgi:hypothetical protein